MMKRLKSIKRASRAMAKMRATLSRKARKERQKLWDLELNQKHDLISFASLRANVFALGEFVPE